MTVLLVLFCVAFTLQVLFIMIFFRAGNVKSNPSEKDDTTRQPVSVIVCAHDEEQNLRVLVPLLLGQDYETFEVIVVNDRSNDGTFDFLRERSSTTPQLKVVQVDHLPAHANGKKYALTLGIKAAKYEVVLLTDADCIPNGNNWIRSMMKQFNPETQLVLGYSPYLKQPGFLNQFIRFETVYTALQYIGFASAGMPYMGVGRNLAYRKSLFLDNKGFNGYLQLTGGDDDLFVNQHATAENTQVSLGAEALVYSKPKNFWGNFFQQKIRHLSVGKFYKLKHKAVVGLLSLSHIVLWITGITLFVTGTWWIGVGLLVRAGMLVFAIQRFSRRAGDKFEVWIVPFLDFLFTIYYLSTGTVALVSKKVQWKS